MTLTVINQCFKLGGNWQLIFNSPMEHTQRQSATNTVRPSYTGAKLVQYKSNEVYYEADVVFLEQPSVQGERPRSGQRESLCLAFC